jgi:hypothetical protein
VQPVIGFQDIFVHSIADFPLMAVSPEKSSLHLTEGNAQIYAFITFLYQMKHSKI